MQGLVQISAFVLLLAGLYTHVTGCPPTFTFNPVRYACERSSSSDYVPGPSDLVTSKQRPLCDAVGVCPIYDPLSLVKHLPHRTRCDVYCRCDHGVPIEMPCPVGTNAALQVCDWPAASGCVEGGARVQGKRK